MSNKVEKFCKTLTKRNIKQWKVELDREMFRQTGFENYSATKADTDWLDDYEFDTVQSAIDDEVSCWTE